MKSKFLCVIASICSIAALKAQEQHITLQQAVELALKNSDNAKLADAKLYTAENKLAITKNLQYPDATLSGQYMYLTNANVDLKLNLNSNSDESSNNASPTINQLMLGQANISMPIFLGFKLKNTVKAAENSYKAASLNAKNDKEKLALQVIEQYINLYKVNQSIILIQENLKSAKQRVKDFTSMEKNGLLARNDLLKAQLQESDIELSLEEAIKNERILNYKLITLLKIPKKTAILTSSDDFEIIPLDITNDSIARNDFRAMKYQLKAAENQIIIARSKYYPSISLSGGYIALDLHNALTVTNAMNAGVGISYNLSDIFKTKSDIKFAKSKVKELEYSINTFSDAIKVQIKNAQEEYQLANKQYQVYIKSVQQAIENYRIVKDKHNNGLLNTNDLLEADVEQLKAKINLAYAKANISLKYYELLSAEGQLINKITN